MFPSEERRSESIKRLFERCVLREHLKQLQFHVCRTKSGSQDTRICMMRYTSLLGRKSMPGYLSIEKERKEIQDVEQ